MRRVAVVACVLISMFGLVACATSEQEIIEENSVVEQDGKLYVHTYSYDYVIELE